MNLRTVFGMNVQRLRRERGLSQEQLSFLARRTRAYISGVEAGRRNATLETLATLAEALGVEPYELIIENDVPQKNRKIPLLQS
jgi:transcriptional regulator with XRE-family HTH domain